MIGYATRNEKEITITQLFARDEADEIKILEKFEEVMESYPNLMGFNSTRFDESFIIERCRKYKIYTKIKSKKHTDMYLTTTKAKCLLDLPNYKQKTIEVFLGLNREDKYNGGELIPIYKNYSLTGDEDSKNLVLLHNLEDIKGMVYICDILAYTDLLSTDLDYISSEYDEDKVRSQFNTSIPLPSSLNKMRDYGMYIISNDILTLALNIKSCELYTFLPDYKNYYYLINEDIIIPKALGESMDKNNRRPAKKQDCKVKLNGKFVQIPEKLDIGTSIRSFKPSYDSKETYVNVDDLTPALLAKIAKYMLKH